MKCLKITKTGTSYRITKCLLLTKCEFFAVFGEYCLRGQNYYFSDMEALNYVGLLVPY